MLFHIDDEIGAIAIANSSALVVDFVEEIFSARAKGRHIIYASKETLDAFLKLNGLSARTLRTIKQVKDRLRSKKYLLQTLKMHVKVVGPNKTFKRYQSGGVEIIDIPLFLLTGDEFFREPTFLVENQSDADYFCKIASNFYYDKPEIGSLNLKFSVFPGGGSQTPRHYSAMKAAAKSLVLCIVDSDVDYKNGPLGTNVAGPIAQCDRASQSPVVRSILLDCYSIENLVPPDLLRLAYSYKHGATTPQPWVKDIDHLVKQDYWPYVALKSPKQCDLLRSNSTKGLYWASKTDSFLKPNSVCKNWGEWDVCRNKCNYLPSISASTLSVVLDYVLKEEQTDVKKEMPKIVKNLPKPMLPMWRLIADEVLAWGCSGSRMLPT